jgi:hypothetical protein
MNLQQAQRLVILTSLIAFAGVSIATVLSLRFKRSLQSFERRVQEEGRCVDVEDRSHR